MFILPIFDIKNAYFQLVFKKKPGSEEDEVEQRRAARRRQREREQGEGPRYDEECYNNLISQEQQRQTRG